MVTKDREGEKSDNTTNAPPGKEDVSSPPSFSDSGDIGFWALESDEESDHDDSRDEEKASDLVEEKRVTEEGDTSSRAGKKRKRHDQAVRKPKIQKVLVNNF